MKDASLLDSAQRMTVYFGESDHWRGKPLSTALLEAIRDQGGAGATLVRGVAGFGAASRIHTASIIRLSEDLPLVLEVVDTPEKIEAMLDLIQPMVREGMITVEPVRVVRYTHRYLNPLPADRLVEEVMTRPVQVLSPEMTVHDAWQKMLEHGIKAMPVVTADGVVVGIITDEDLLQRAGLKQRLAVAARMQPELIKKELRSLEKLTTRVYDVMTAPVVTAATDESLGQAAERMARNRLKRLPVIDREGRLAGILSRLDILRQIETGELPRLPEKSLAEEVRTVQDVMRDVPTVRVNDDLQAVVDKLSATGLQKLVVVDEDNHPVGLVSDSDVVSRIQPAEQPRVLRALARRSGSLKIKVRADEIMSPGVITVPPEMPVADAAGRMLAEGRKWIVVVDAQGRALGLVDRQILLQAVAGSV